MSDKKAVAPHERPGTPPLEARPFFAHFLGDAKNGQSPGLLKPKISPLFKRGISLQFLKLDNFPLFLKEGILISFVN